MDNSGPTPRTFRPQSLVKRCDLHEVRTRRRDKINRNHARRYLAKGSDYPLSSQRPSQKPSENLFSTCMWVIKQATKKDSYAAAATNCRLRSTRYPAPLLGIMPASGKQRQSGTPNRAAKAGGTPKECGALPVRTNQGRAHKSPSSRRAWLSLSGACTRAPQ